MERYVLGYSLILCGVVVFAVSVLVYGTEFNCGACFYNPTAATIGYILNWLEVLGVLVCLAGLASLAVQFVSKHTQ